LTLPAGTAPKRICRPVRVLNPWPWMRTYVPPETAPRMGSTDRMVNAPANAYADARVSVPLVGHVTTRSAGPGLPAGAAAVAEVVPTKVAVSGRPPREKLQPASKLAPVIVRLVPPTSGPPCGVM